jgi:hypothetical protein
MTKDEIKAIVAEKIAGQGSAIDAASVLPTILDAIIDIIPSGGGRSEQISMNLGDLFENKTAEEAAEIFGITNEQFERLVTGRYCSALEEDVAISYLVTVADDGDKVYFFSGDSGGIGCSFSLLYSNGLYTFAEV